MPQPDKRRRRSAWVTLILSFMCCAIPFVLEVIGLFVGMLISMEVAEAIALVVGGVGACLAIAIMGGTRLIVPTRAAFAAALKKGWWAIATSAALMVIEITWTYVAGEKVIESGWLGRLFTVTAICVGVGLMEEGMFRGLLLNGLLDLAGTSRRGLYRAVIIASVVFGLAHIDFTSFNFADPLACVQALLKVLQTGTYGFFLASLIVSSKSIIGAAFIHGIDNFLLMAPSMVLLKGSLDVAYVTTGDDAWPTIILYCVIIVLYIPLVVVGKRMLDKAPVPELGAFHKEG